MGVALAIAVILLIASALIAWAYHAGFANGRDEGISQASDLMFGWKDKP